MITIPIPVPTLPAEQRIHKLRHTLPGMVFGHPQSQTGHQSNGEQLITSRCRKPTTNLQGLPFPKFRDIDVFKTLPRANVVVVVVVVVVGGNADLPVHRRRKHWQ